MLLIESYGISKQKDNMKISSKKPKKKEVQFNDLNIRIPTNVKGELSPEINWKFHCTCNYCKSMMIGTIERIKTILHFVESKEEFDKKIEEMKEGLDKDRGNYIG